MTTHDADAAAPEPTSRRELAVARSLDNARARAEHRVQRFLDAAFELMNDGDGKEFTVQEVVERSGQSLRSFYQYFDGKDELLLALFEESVRSTAEEITRATADGTDPTDRLRRFVLAYDQMCRPIDRSASNEVWMTPVIIEFAQKLLTDHPEDAARAFAPMMGVLRSILDDAASAGSVRPGLRHDRVAGIVLEAIMFDAFSSVIVGGATGSRTDRADQLMSFVFDGIGSGEHASGDREPAGSRGRRGRS